MTKNRFTISIPNTIVLLLSILVCGGQSFLVQYSMMMCYLVAFLFVFWIAMRHMQVQFDRDVKILLCIVLFLGISILFSKDSSQTNAYMRLFVCIFIMALIDLPDNSTNLFIRLCNLFSIIVGISIIAEAFIPNLICERLWFIATLSHNQDILYSIQKAVADGMHSGFACEKSAAAFIMNIGLSCEAATYFTNNKLKRTDIVSVIILVIGLLLTGKRMLLAVPVIIFTVMLLFSKRRNKSATLLLSLALVIAIVFIALNVMPKSIVVFDRFTMYEDDTLRGRDLLWTYALLIFKSNPLIGCGFGAYNTLASSLGLTTGSGAIWSTNAHNIYIQLLAETGIIGTLLFSIWMFKSLIDAIKLNKIIEVVDTETQHDKVFTYFCIFVQCVILLYGLTGNPIYVVNELMLYGFSIVALGKIRKKYRSN